MHLNLLSDKDNERSLFNAAGNGDVQSARGIGTSIWHLHMVQE